MDWIVFLYSMALGWLVGSIWGYIIGSYLAFRDIKKMYNNFLRNFFKELKSAYKSNYTNKEVKE